MVEGFGALMIAELAPATNAEWLRADP